MLVDCGVKVWNEGREWQLSARDGRIMDTVMSNRGRAMMKSRWETSGVGLLVHVFFYLEHANVVETIQVCSSWNVASQAKEQYHDYDITIGEVKGGEVSCLCLSSRRSSLGNLG